VALRNCLSAMKRALVQVKKATEEAPLRAELLSVAVRISGYDILSAANGSQSPTQSGRGGDLTASSPSVIVAPPISPFLLARRKFVLEGSPHDPFPLPRSLLLISHVVCRVCVVCVVCRVQVRCS
jgi:hypothetical protein